MLYHVEFWYIYITDGNDDGFLTKKFIFWWESYTIEHRIFVMCFSIECITCHLFFCLQMTTYASIAFYNRIFKTCWNIAYFDFIFIDIMIACIVNHIDQMSDDVFWNILINIRCSIVLDFCSNWELAQMVSNWIFAEPKFCYNCYFFYDSWCELDANTTR